MKKIFLLLAAFAAVVVADAKPKQKELNLRVGTYPYALTTERSEGGSPRPTAACGGLRGDAEAPRSKVIGAPSRYNLRVPQESIAQTKK